MFAIVLTLLDISNFEGDNEVAKCTIWYNFEKALLGKCECFVIDTITIKKWEMIKPMIKLKKIVWNFIVLERLWLREKKVE